MGTLSEKMQERLDNWRKKTLTVPTKTKVVAEQAVRRGGKGDYGDIISVEQWEDEIKKSQTRR